MFSGDGIIFEVTNGLADIIKDIPDKMIMDRITLAPIPCGSGNALA